MHSYCNYCRYIHTPRQCAVEIILSMTLYTTSHKLAEVIVSCICCAIGSIRLTVSTLYFLFPRKSLLATVVYGLTYAFSQSLVFFMYATIFRFGAYQVTRDDDNIAYAEFTDVFRVFTALIFGTLAVGQASSFAPNYAKAKISANRIFALLDREPLIDSYSEDGERLVSTMCI